ncbi:type IV toxin-antitoxin system AbiEi family antitoxin domain-containing protein [Nocardioides sp. NPDC000445]|uniref:type IV toxin-antitoxin system AbiEi family antitoxin domain-containing protein n=1 Tax=Nocardioides sp. NPDC000445 TaxID=3154257 RepID=UPI00331946A5
MDALQYFIERDGFFTTQMALEVGYAKRDITRMTRSGEWHRIRRGAYAPGATWLEFDEVARHQVRSRAVMRSLGDAVALSHTSAVVAHGIDIWNLPLDRVHVTRLDGGAGRIEGDVVHHEGFSLDHEVVAADGMKAVLPERCVLEAASRVDTETAWCLLDAGLRSGTFDRDGLKAAYEVVEHWPFMHRVGGLVPFADGRSGSIGESRGKHLFRSFGLPQPQLQYEVRRADGSIAGVTDWAWPEFGLLGEFDGRVKYGRLLKPGQDPGDVVFEEKRREDELRELTGFWMIRLIWSDFANPAVTAARIRRALRRAS